MGRKVNSSVEKVKDDKANMTASSALEHDRPCVTTAGT